MIAAIVPENVRKSAKLNSNLSSYREIVVVFMANSGNNFRNPCHSVSGSSTRGFARAGVRTTSASWDRSDTAANAAHSHGYLQTCTRG